MNDQEIRAFKKTIHGAHRHTIGVLALDTGFRHYIGHETATSTNKDGA
jgi:hypothetical protein